VRHYVVIEKDMMHLKNTSLKSFNGRPYLIVLCLLVLLIFLPIFYVNSYVNAAETDFRSHIDYAVLLKNGYTEAPEFMRAHFGWQLLLILINYITGLSFETASVIAALFCEVITAFVLFQWFLPVLVEKDSAPLKKVMIVLGLMIASPISVFWILDGQMYLGYIGITTYHNPSIILLKPLAILQFIYAYSMFTNRKFHWWQTGVAFVVPLITTFVKPSFAICILPALGIMTLYYLAQKKPVDFRGLLVGLLIPMVGMLVWQFIITYISHESPGIAFMPFGVMEVFSKYLLPKLVASILFPLSVTILYFKRASLDVRMILSWLVFLFGALFTYFFAETGRRFYDDNFGWSGEIALVILFITSTLFYLEISRVHRYGDIMLKIMWASHVVFGVAYYFYCLFTRSYT
jgi:hypothetical protein